MVLLLAVQVGLLWTHGSLLQRQHEDIQALREDIQALADSLDQDQDGWDSNDDRPAPGPRGPRRQAGRPGPGRLVRRMEARRQGRLRPGRIGEEQGPGRRPPVGQEAVAKAREVQEKLSIRRTSRRPRRRPGGGRPTHLDALAVGGAPAVALAAGGPVPLSPEGLRCRSTNISDGGSPVRRAARPGRCWRWGPCWRTRIRPPTLAVVDGWVHDLAGRMPLPWNFHGAIDVLNHYLFQEVGLQGDQETYDDPANAAHPQGHRPPAGHAHHPLHPVDGRGPAAGLPAPWAWPCPGTSSPACAWTWASCTSIPSTAAAPWARRGRPGWWSGPPAAGPPSIPPCCCRSPTAPSWCAWCATSTCASCAPSAWDEALWTSTHLVLLSPGESLPYRDRAFVHFKRGRDGRGHEGPQGGHPPGPGDRSGTRRSGWKSCSGAEAMDFARFLELARSHGWQGLSLWGVLLLPGPAVGGPGAPAPGPAAGGGALGGVRRQDPLGLPAQGERRRGAERAQGAPLRPAGGPAGGPELRRGQEPPRGALAAAALEDQGRACAPTGSAGATC